MALPLDTTLKIGVSTMYRRTEPATGPWIPRIDEMVEVVSLVDRLGYDFVLGRRSHLHGDPFP